MKRKQLLLLLALLMTAATGAWAQESETYAVKMKAGTEDAKNWTITSGQKSATGDEPDGLAGLEEDDEVTLTYGGRLKVKSVTAVQVPDATDLSMLDCAGTPRTDGRWTANCYMVHTAGYYKLPLVYGNAIKAGQANTAAYTGVESESNNTTVTFPNHAGEAINAPWITKKTTGTGVDKGMGIAVTSAELLWQDAEGLVTAVDIDGDYLTLTVGKDATTKEGNAVVAAKDADGTIVWSWHIWVTKQTFADADLTTIITTDNPQTDTQGKDWQIYKVTPVNLGWVGDKVSTGTNTFYQWGRKDPFIGTGDVEFVESTTATIADNIKNPTTFYNVGIEKSTETKTETHYYPCTVSYLNLWNATQPKWPHYSYAEATVKTVYDPCPAGFCVPTSNLYEYFQDYIGNNNTPDWDDTYKGYSVNIGTPNLFFPATGQRSCTNGKLAYVGTDGCCWSAYSYKSTFADFGHTLYFVYVSDSYKGWVTANKDRAYGYPVRAVREVATSDAPAGPKAAKDATAEDLGKVIGADGNIYDDADAATAASTTAVAKIFYVGSDNGEDAPYNHGLALALGDVSDTKNWCSQDEATCLGTGHQFDSKAGAKGDMAGIDNTDALVNNTGHTHDAASAARGYNSGTHPAGTSAWFLPSAGQWDKMATAAGSYANLINNAGLQGGDAAYWSSTEGGADYAWLFDSSNGDLNTYGKDYDFQVRACLAF